MRWHYAMIALGSSTLVHAAVPLGDTQGRVATVRIMRTLNGVQSFQVWFSSVSNDRWGCIADDGYVVVAENGAGVTSDSYKALLAVSLAAQVSEKALALDSAGTNPCANVNMAWMVD